MIKGGRDEIVAQVNAVLQEGFEVDPAKLKADAHLYHDLGIDSLDAIDMLVYIEERIGRTVDATLFKNVRKVSDIYDVMEKILAEDQGAGPAADPVVDQAVAAATPASAAKSM